MHHGDIRQCGYVNSTAIHLLCIGMLLSGCGGSKKPSTNNSRQTSKNITLPEALGNYRAGRYEEAYQQAVILKSRLAGDQAHEAAFVAGMSAFRLDREDDALKHLTPLSDNRSDTITGPSCATLGLIWARRADHPRALDYFTKATRRLKGNDLAQAYYHMAITEQKLGLYAQAKPHLVLAVSNATDSVLRSAAEDRMKSSGFTIQFGAYSSQRNAEQRRQQVLGDTQRAGLGQPWVLATVSRNKQIYVVQAGRFGTYEAALGASRKLGRNDVVVEKLQTP